MLTVNSRLNLKKDFRWVRSGNRLENNLIQLYYKFGENSNPRLGISTPSKDFKNAVERNRARRLISKWVEDLYINLPKNINLLVFPKRVILDYKLVSVKSELKELVNEIPTN